MTASVTPEALQREVEQLREERLNMLDDWRDVAQRFDRAADALVDLAVIEPTDREAVRLVGKCEGVKLALSYLREYRWVVAS